MQQSNLGHRDLTGCERPCSCGVQAWAAQPHPGLCVHTKGTTRGYGLRLSHGAIAAQAQRPGPGQRGLACLCLPLSQHTHKGCGAAQHPAQEREPRGSSWEEVFLNTTPV